MRRTAVLLILAVLGVGAALGIGLAANAISGDSIGLSARPLRAGDELAPPQAPEPGDDRPARTTTATTTRTERTSPRRPRPTTTTATPTTTTATPTTTEPGDDH